MLLISYNTCFNDHQIIMTEKFQGRLKKQKFQQLTKNWNILQFIWLKIK